MDTYKYNPMAALLARWENINKYKHGKHCNNQRKMFLLFVLSVDRILGREALVLLYLSQVMSEKREETIFEVRGRVNGRTAITVARSYSRMIREV